MNEPLIETFPPEFPSNFPTPQELAFSGKCPNCGFWPDEPDTWGIEVFPTEFEVWRANHKHHKDPGGVIPRCPRCFSTKVKKDDTYIRCLGCRYSEFLVDYPTA